MSAAAVLGLVGCSSDEAALAPESTSPPSSEPVATVTPAPSSTSPTSSPSSATGTELPAGAVASISFTFTASSTGAGGGDRRGGGMVRNPYIAVWIEDARGALVRTVALWHLTAAEDRWLNSLTRWYQVAGGVETTSSATRPPGAYTVEWDGTDAEGGRVATGRYAVCIEASREHGPYELIRKELDFATRAFTVELEPSNELSAASVAFRI